MAKAYDLQFHLAPYRGSVGTMVCAHCGKSIDAERHDFREAKKSDPDEGWGFVVHHRECLPDHGDFLKAEKAVADVVAHQMRLLAAAVAFRAEWGVHDLDQLIDELS